MSDELPQFEDNPAYRGHRERIEQAAGDAAALADLTVEIGGDWDITQEEEDDLLARVQEALDEIGAEEPESPTLPSALMVCPYCSEIRDRAPGGTRSLCLCQGTRCRHCHAGRIRRPVSDYYNATTLGFWHVPHFGARGPCRHCVAQKKRLGDGAWPQVRTLIQEAADALGEPSHDLHDDALPAYDLVALHGDVEVWHDFWLGAPPDGRPLYVGRAIPELRHRPFGLRVATWTAEDPGTVSGVLSDLLVRWQPPLNNEVETPWNR